MFKRQTLFVIGAGASQELKMPVGTELAMAIHSTVKLKRGEWGANLSGARVAQGSTLVERHSLRSAFRWVHGPFKAADPRHPSSLQNESPGFNRGFQRRPMSSI
jgi:hypothetical protein